jgi:hypothetical protein
MQRLARADVAESITLPPHDALLEHRLLELLPVDRAESVDQTLRLLPYEGGEGGAVAPRIVQVHGDEAVGVGRVEEP